MTRRVGVERAVEKVRKSGGDVHYLSYVVSERDVVTLIRCELAKERARVRRIVKATQLSDFAKNHILNALSGRKGTR